MKKKRRKKKKTTARTENGAAAKTGNLIKRQAHAEQTGNVSFKVKTFNIQPISNG